MAWSHALYLSSGRAGSRGLEEMGFIES